MEYDYTPKACQGEEAKFSGKVRLKGLDFDKKMEMLETLSAEGMDLSKAKEQAEKDPMSMMKLMRKLVRDSGDLWVSCDIKEKETELEFKSRDDIACYNNTHIILMDVAMHVLGGSSLGK